jgi:hypothetical protein
MSSQLECFDYPPSILKERICLNPVSKNMKGTLELNVREEQKCEKPECLTLKTGHLLKLRVASNAPCDSRVGRLLTGTIVVERLITAFNVDGEHRGFHAGDFTWTGTKTQIAGRMSGMTNVGTHRLPVFRDCQRCDERGVMEGRICGRVIKTEVEGLKECQLFGSYRISFDSSVGGGSGAVSGVIEAVLICPCK